MKETKNEYSIKKSTVECYKIRCAQDYWADITIDADGEGGRISIASDFGDWQRYWAMCGRPFKKFLTTINMDYAAGKFGVDNYFDADKTTGHFKLCVREARKSKSITAEQAKELYEEIDELTDYGSRESFGTEMWHQTNLMNFFDHYPPMSESIDPKFLRFWNELWPVFVSELKNEDSAISEI